MKTDELFTKTIAERGVRSSGKSPGHFESGGQERDRQFRMKYSKDKYDWLDEMLGEALHATNVGPDFEKWKREHPAAVQALRLTDTAVKQPPKDQESRQ